MLAITGFTQSGVLLTFIMMSLYAALLSQAWNILGGYGGQLSFGHALFFGVGAYAQRWASCRWAGIPGWPCPVRSRWAWRRAGRGRADVPLRLRGSYFALVTLAFAEVLRIVATSVSFTGGGVGLMLPARSATNMQFPSRHGYIYLILAFVLLALAVTAWLRARASAPICRPCATTRTRRAPSASIRCA